MEEKKEIGVCNGRCEMCNINQRSYCSAQKAYYIEQELIEIKRLLSKGNDDKIETLFIKENNVVVSDIA